MTDRLDRIAETVRDKGIMTRDDEIQRLRGQLNMALDALKEISQFGSFESARLANATIIKVIGQKP